MNAYLGVDLGTTGLKALLVREDGSIVGSGYSQYAIRIPQAGYAEQNPHDWWRALVEATTAAMRGSDIKREEIRGIGLSGQMHGTVLLDRNDKLLCPAIIWCDQRAADQVEAVREKVGQIRLGTWTQNPIATGFQAVTLLWVRKNRPDLFRQIAHVLLPKDYIRFLMTGQYGTDPTDACGTLLFHCGKRAWSKEMLGFLELDERMFPEVADSPMAVQGGLSASAAEALGLRAGIPVVYGGGDQPMQAIGNGILAPGDASITLGTGGQVFVPITQPDYDPQLRTHMFCHAPENGWYMMGAILNCCLAQNWLLEKVLYIRNPDAAHKEAARIAPGSDGLYFLPYLTGERTPYMDASLTGAFCHLTLRHERAHMIRAVIEGVTYALRDAMECMLPYAPEIKRLVLSGGGARSGLWRQIIADVLDRPIYITNMAEEAGIGAAICAMVGTGAYGTLQEACGQIVRDLDDITLPDAACTVIYQEHFETYRSIGKTLRTARKQM